MPNRKINIRNNLTNTAFIEKTENSITQQLFS